ncbi:MAG TPA: hypothetical protein VKM35_04450 [Arenimonas sp.]|uniref:hypothetical protein n=1 Tax=Arenimonas sp. TaxID=1872635 RepID=UPI002B626847|nr:hypothetical protein [Arenimonas sp.]HMB56439.1 hypothetical protein [Arenimonas sp.]
MALRRRTRWLIVLTLAALAIGAWWINRQLEPHRLTTLVLAKAGDALQLDLRYSGEPDYALKPEPRLLIPNLEVRGRSDGEIFLSAKRAEISLPWDTITGGEPVITRIELDTPVIDIPGLRRWLATRPPTPFKLPTLTRGVHLTDGSVHDANYSLSKLSLDLPRLKTGEAAEVTTAGVFTQGKTSVDFKAFLTAATPGLASDFTLSGSGALLQSDKPLPFKLHADGHYLSDDNAFSIEAKSLALEATSPLPSLDGKAGFKLGERMDFRLDGVLAHWPEDWPALPQPIATHADKLPFVLSYSGASDLGDPLHLQLAQDATRLQASLQLAQMQGWLASSDGSPLPPLNATMQTPSLEFDGIKLEGVELEIRDSNGAPKP